jgi:hypothetical protein
MKDRVRTGSDFVEPEGWLLGLLRAAAPVFVLVGAAGSLGFLLGAGSRAPRLLLVLFVLWVLSPFMALAWANLASKRWSVVTRGTLYTVTVVLTLGSLAIYGPVGLGLSRTKPAAIFLLFPLASWLLTVTVVPSRTNIS